MGEVVNLRMARKRAARKVREALADDNRASHSVSVRERRKAAAERELAARRLDGARRGTGPDEETTPPENDPEC